MTIHWLYKWNLSTALQIGCCRWSRAGPGVAIVGMCCKSSYKPSYELSYKLTYKSANRASSLWNDLQTELWTKLRMELHVSDSSYESSFRPVNWAVNQTYCTPESPQYLANGAQAPFRCFFNFCKIEYCNSMLLTLIILSKHYHNYVALQYLQHLK